MQYNDDNGPYPSVIGLQFKNDNPILCHYLDNDLNSFGWRWLLPSHKILKLLAYKQSMVCQQLKLRTLVFNLV
jgi:hypothetical protein